MQGTIIRRNFDDFSGVGGGDLVTVDDFFEQFNQEILKEPYYAPAKINNFCFDTTEISCAKICDNFRTINDDINTIYQNLVNINAFTSKCCYASRSSCIESKVPVVEKHYNDWVLSRALNIIKRTINHISNYIFALFDI